MFERRKPEVPGVLRIVRVSLTRGHEIDVVCQNKVFKAGRTWVDPEQRQRGKDVHVRVHALEGIVGVEAPNVVESARGLAVAVLESRPAVLHSTALVILGC